MSSHSQQVECFSAVAGRGRRSASPVGCNVFLFPGLLGLHL